MNEPTPLPESFFPDAAAFLDLLAVSHAAAVVPLAALSGRIDQSAGRLLGREGQSPGIYQSWPAEGFDGFAECPALSPEALEDAREVFENRENVRYRSLAHIVGRLARALARDGRFAAHDKVVDVAIAVPSIYSIVPPNDGSALRHGHHFEPVDFVIDHGRGHHDAYSAGSCQRTYARACGCRQRPRRHREELIESEPGVVRPRGVRNDDADRRPWARKRPFRTRPAERVVHPVCPCRSTGGSLNRDNSRGMSQECAANAAR